MYVLMENYDNELTYDDNEHFERQIAVSKNIESLMEYAKHKIAPYTLEWNEIKDDENIVFKSSKVDEFIYTIERTVFLQ